MSTYPDAPKLVPAGGRVVAAVWFKEEDETATGEPYGPAGFVYTDQTDDERRGWRPFDPNREPDPWYPLSYVEKVAAELGVEVQAS